MNRITRVAAAVLAILFLGAFIPQTKVSAATVKQVNEIKVYNYLVGKMGLNTAAACGLMANAQEESGFNVTEVGDKNTSIGLFQWHLGRKTNLIKYCQEKGLDYQTVEGQLSYLDYELKKSYKSVYNHIKGVENTADGAYDAAYYWCYYYEVPSNRAYKSDKRGSLAKNTYWKKYKGYNGKQVEISDSSSAGNTKASSTTTTTASATKNTTTSTTVSSTTKTTAAASANSFKRTLKVQSPCMKGTDVKYIQTSLKTLGYSISTDGAYGKGTAAVVKKFQSKQGIKATGRVNKATWNAIVKAVAKVKPLKITQQPKAVTVKSGEKATFSVKATGNGLTYQWYYKKVGSNTWTKWKGQNKATVTAKSKDCWANRYVRCTVKDSSGKTVNSKAVKITITSKSAKTTAAAATTTTTVAAATAATTSAASGDVAVG